MWRMRHSFCAVTSREYLHFEVGVRAANRNEQVLGDRTFSRDVSVFPADARCQSISVRLTPHQRWRLHLSMIDPRWRWAWLAACSPSEQLIQYCPSWRRQRCICIIKSPAEQSA